MVGNCCRVAGVGVGDFVIGGGAGLRSPSNPNGSVQRKWNSPGKNEIRRRRQSKKVVVCFTEDASAMLMDVTLMRSCSR